jgi:Ulp1 family protease
MKLMLAMARWQSKVESGLQQLLESRRVQEFLESTVQTLLDSSRVQELLESSRVEELIESRSGSSSFKPRMQSKPSDLEQMEQQFAGKTCLGMADNALLNATVYYPSKKSKDAVSFDKSHLKCLEPTVWISNTIVDFCIKHILYCHDAQKENLSKFHFFNSFIYRKLVAVKDDDQVGLRLFKLFMLLSLLQGSKPDPNAWQCAGILQGG